MVDSISGNLWFKLRTTEVNISRRRKYIADFGGRLLLIVTSWQKNSICKIVNFKTLRDGGSQVSRMHWEHGCLATLIVGLGFCVSVLGFFFSLFLCVLFFQWVFCLVVFISFVVWRPRSLTLTLLAQPFVLFSQNCICGCRKTKISQRDDLCLQRSEIVIFSFG